MCLDSLLESRIDIVTIFRGCLEEQFEELEIGAPKSLSFQRQRKVVLAWYAVSSSWEKLKAPVTGGSLVVDSRPNRDCPVKLSGHFGTTHLPLRTRYAVFALEFMNWVTIFPFLSVTTT